MHHIIGRLRAAPIAFAYQHVLKKLFFRKDPEVIHDQMTATGVRLGSSRAGRLLTAAAFRYQHLRLTQTIEGIQLSNPIGLAAGFDKDGLLAPLVGSIGFGSLEIGTITNMPAEGNAKPRLWRMPQAESLVVHYGLKNQGAEALVARMQQLPTDRHPAALGISVAPTNTPSLTTQAALIDDTVAAAAQVSPYGDWLTINLSCPNACQDKPFEKPQSLDALLTALATLPELPPVFIKLSPDLHAEDAHELLTVAANHGVSGVILGNLTKDTRALPNGTLIPGPGGYSGKPTAQRSARLLYDMAGKWKREFTYVACGGIFTVDDAYSRIRLGASFVQLVSGLIFKGPQLPGQLNAQLVARLKRDGFTHISEAVGADVWRG
jgi:dihydroorotate dehydrogenase subfamily 2